MICETEGPTESYKKDSMIPELTPQPNVHYLGHLNGSLAAMDIYHNTQFIMLNLRHLVFCNIPFLPIFANIFQQTIKK